jgi:hypothetical protein
MKNKSHHMNTNGICVTKSTMAVLHLEGVYPRLFRKMEQALKQLGWCRRIYRLSIFFYEKESDKASPVIFLERQKKCEYQKN